MKRLRPAVCASDSSLSNYPFTIVEPVGKVFVNRAPRIRSPFLGVDGIIQSVFVIAVIRRKVNNDETKMIDYAIAKTKKKKKKVNKRPILEVLLLHEVY